MRSLFILTLLSATTTTWAFITSSRNSFVDRKFVTHAMSASKVQLNYDTNVVDSIAAAESKHGMPWVESIDKKAFKDEELLYMPFWNWHLKFITENLTNVRVVSCSNEKTDFSYNENKSKKARIVNICLSSDEYRKIRMTYYDAGENTQVYNAVCYPDPKYNLPVLGVDLLAFNRKKYLSIVDFQPLHSNEDDHAATYEHLMKPVKESYDNLSGKMSSKFYDETQFFSQQMLFARFENEKIIQNELFPAFQEYVKIHLDLIRSVDEDVSKVPFVLEHQQAYDTYSAERDPATGLFTAMFGNEWAQDFVHDFLFSMSERNGNVAVKPVHQQAPPQHQPVVGFNNVVSSQHSRQMISNRLPAVPAFGR